MSETPTFDTGPLRDRLNGLTPQDVQDWELYSEWADGVTQMAQKLAELAYAAGQDQRTIELLERIDLSALSQTIHDAVGDVARVTRPVSVWRDLYDMLAEARRRAGGAG